MNYPSLIYFSVYSKTSRESRERKGFTSPRSEAAVHKDVAEPRRLRADFLRGPVHGASQGRNHQYSKQQDHEIGP